MTTPKTSAIVVTYHTGPRLRDCLYALKSDPEVDEIIIVDNGNPEPLSSWLSEDVAGWDKTRALLRSGKNLGFGAACNKGAEAAAGDVLIFINPDAMIRRQSVSKFQEVIDANETPCLVGGKIFGTDGKEQRGARRNELTWATALGLKKWTLHNKGLPDGPMAVPAISGAFFAIRKADFAAVGGFDEQYFLHVEDVDLCRSVRAAGGAVIYQPLAAALHFGATSDAPSAVVAAHKADSLTYYFKKWARGPLDRLLNTFLLPLLRWQVKRKAR